DAVKLAFRTVLVSPNFLYRVEVDPPDAKGSHPVSAYELATRLSYFVWSSTPDDDLLARAEDGSLVEPEVFASQLERVLAHRKADALVDNFAAQWLDTRSLDNPNRAPPDPKAFPAYDDELRQAMIAESLMFFRAFLRSDRNAADMLDA